MKKIAISSTKLINTLAAVALSSESLDIPPEEFFLVVFTYGQPYVTEGIDVLLNVVGLDSDDANYRLSASDVKEPGRLPHLSYLLFPAIAANYAVESGIGIVVSDSSKAQHSIEAVSAMFENQRSSTNDLLGMLGQPPIDIHMPLMDKTPSEVEEIAFEYLKEKFVEKGLDELSAQEQVAGIFAEAAT